MPFPKEVMVLRNMGKIPRTDPSHQSAGDFLIRFFDAMLNCLTFWMNDFVPQSQQESEILKRLRSLVERLSREQVVKDLILRL